MGNDSNNVPIFEEKAEQYGLDSPAFSNQGYFFDYDKDGDLDMLLLNHNPKSLPVLNEVSTKEYLKKDDPLQGIRLFEQRKDKFYDITKNAGISGSALTYGLGIGISDVNNDGWLDFYVSNDYTVPDYLYINKKNGTFEDQLGLQIGHTSHFSMGNNIADINNDGWQDIFTLDMLPEENNRQKLLLSPDNYEKFDLNLRSGFHHQYMRNMLQLNNGDDSFSEIGQLSGISNTDWSWAPLFADFDNDGLKDLFVTNGYFRDYTNLDFINYMEDFVQAKGRLQRQDVLELIKEMPSSDLTNYYFSNTDGLTFINNTKTVGMDQPANSNGAIYVDLDNDGDLEIVVNNINKPAFIYRNDSPNSKNKFLSIELQGEDKNTNGIGSKLTLYSDGKSQVLEQMPTQGYLSTVTPTLHFGIGENMTIDSLVVQWNSGKSEVLTKIVPNIKIVINEENAGNLKIDEQGTSQIFKEIKPPVSYVNTSSGLNDFKRQPLLTKQMSHRTPPIQNADLNKDGLEDIIIGGGIGQSTSVYLQKRKDEFYEINVRDFEMDKDHFDSAIAIYDADLDGNLDVYIASGGYHDFNQDDPLLQDRLYLGNGTGDFKKNAKALPKMLTSTGAVAFYDINQDSYIDLFVGGYVVPGSYPESPRSYILINDGKGNYSDQTEEIQSALKYPGMVTDAAWADVNGDQLEDLVLTGNWMPISIYINEDGKLLNETIKYFSKEYFGLWNTLTLTDVNNDNRLDIVAGNIGSNIQFKLSKENPAELYFADFDNNGSIDPILNLYVKDKSFPYLTRDELLGQLSYLRSKFNSYESYADATIQDIFNDKELIGAKKLIANYQETTLFLATADDGFKIIPLPIQSQFAPVSSILTSDFDHDGNSDILLLGNNDYYKLRIGKFDANYGTLLLGDGTGSFLYQSQKKSGLSIKLSNSHAIILDDKVIMASYGLPLKTYKF